MFWIGSELSLKMQARKPNNGLLRLELFENETKSINDMSDHRNNWAEMFPAEKYIIQIF